MDTESYNLFDTIIKIAAALGAVIAFLYSLRQYKKGQMWQKADVILNLIDSFERDEQIDLACSLIDWDEREVDIGLPTTFRFRNELLVKALEVREMDSDFTPEESKIRDAFDAFFDFFEKLYSFQRTGLLSFGDLAYFYYWFELLRDIGRYKKIPSLQPAISKYLEAYHFRGVQELLRQYSLNPEPLDIMKE